MGIRARLRRYGKRTRVLVAAGVFVALLTGAGAYAAIGGTARPQSASDIELQRGLVGWWKLDGNGKDSTPFGRNGTVYGTTNVADREGKANAAKSFNGTSDDIGVANFDSNVVTAASFSSSWTLSIWAKQNGSNVNEAVMLGKSGCNGGIEASGSTGYRFTLFNTACNFTYNVPVTPTDVTKWHLLTGTYNNGLMTLYLDGQIVSTTTASSIYPYDNILRIGGNGASFEFNGSLDDARVYNRALSGAEAKALYDQYDPGVATDSGENGLVGWWKLDGNAKDSTPYGHNGTVTGATLTSDRKGRVNGAYSFPGSGNNNIDIGTFPIYNSPEITLAAWVNPTSLTGTPEIIARELQYKIRTDSSGRLCVLVSGNGSAWNYIGCTGTTNLVTTGTWTHVAVTISSAGNSIKYYINGALIGTDVLGTTITAYNTNDLLIGAYNGGGAEPFAGSISDARIYNRALSQSEIQSIASSYNSQINLNSSATNSISTGNINAGLVGYWPFNGNAKDATPFGNNGTVNGATLIADRKGRTSSAYGFDGTSQYISVPGYSALNPGSSDFSIAVWAKEAAGNYGDIINTSNNNQGNFVQGYGLAFGGDVTVFCGGSSTYGRLVFNMANGSARDTSLCSTASYSDAQWHHIVVTVNRSSNTKVLYVDGQQVASVTNAFTGSVTNASFVIGKAIWWNYLNGGLDELRQYNRVLSATEVQTLYNAAN